MNLSGKKVGFLITGQPRSFKHSAPTLLGNLIKLYDNDIFIACSENNANFVKFKNFDSSCQELIECYNPKAYAILNDIEIEREKYNFHPFETSYNQFYKNYIAFSLLEAYAEQRNIEYDIVFKLRPDMALPKPLDINFSIDENTIITNYIGQPVYGGTWVADFLGYGKYDAMKKYCSVIKHIQTFLKSGVRFHPETILGHTLNGYSISIQTQQIPTQLVRENGEFVMGHYL